MNFKFSAFFIPVLFLLFIVELNSVAKVRFENYSNYSVRSLTNLIYNRNLYLLYEENNAIEPYLTELRYKIIRNIQPLVIIKYKYDPQICSLYSLANIFGIDVNSIRSTNYIEALGLLYRGKQLLLHNKKGMLYKIREDKLDISTLAKKFKKSVEEICSINEISAVHVFQRGDLVFIPNYNIKFKDFMLPLFNAKITSGFGLREHPIFGILKYHEGIDLKQKYGAPVRAACDGKVIFAGWAEGYGKLIILKHHKRYTTYYGHLSKIKVRQGQYVYKGQVIGNVGNTGWTTGPHLHFEVRKDGVPIDPKKVVF